MKKKGRRPKKRRPLSPHKVAREIASGLQNLGLKGRFTVEEMVVDDTLWQGEKSYQGFYWLKSADPNWIEFRAEMYSRYAQEIEAAADIARAFLKPLIKGGYTGRSIALVNTVIGDGEPEWRSLTATFKARGTLGQVGDATSRWMNKPEYQSLTGFAIRIELPTGR